MVTALYDGNNSNKTPVAAIQPILTSEEMVNLPIEELLARNLQYLRRSGLISVDWSKRTIKREKPLIEYVKKNIIGGPIWSTIGEDWRKMYNILLNKHGAVNTEYQQLLPKQ